MAIDLQPKNKNWLRLYRWSVCGLIFGALVGLFNPIMMIDLDSEQHIQELGPVRYWWGSMQLALPGAGVGAAVCFGVSLIGMGIKTYAERLGRNAQNVSVFIVVLLSAAAVYPIWTWQGTIPRLLRQISSLIH